MLEILLPADFVGKVRIESHNPDTESQLILDLESNLTSKYRRQAAIAKQTLFFLSVTYPGYNSRAHAINTNEGSAIIINSQHHLQAACDRLEVVCIRCPHLVL